MARKRKKFNTKELLEFYENEIDRLQSQDPVCDVKTILNEFLSEPTDIDYNMLSTYKQHDTNLSESKKKVRIRYKNEKSNNTSNNTDIYLQKLDILAEAINNYFNNNNDKNSFYADYMYKSYYKFLIESNEPPQSKDGESKGHKALGKVKISEKDYKTLFKALYVRLKPVATLPSNKIIQFTNAIEEFIRKRPKKDVKVYEAFYMSYNAVIGNFLTIIDKLMDAEKHLAEVKPDAKIEYPPYALRIYTLMKNAAFKIKSMKETFSAFSSKGLSKVVSPKIAKMSSAVCSIMAYEDYLLIRTAYTDKKLRPKATALVKFHKQMIQGFKLYLEALGKMAKSIQGDIKEFKEDLGKMIKDAEKLQPKQFKKFEEKTQKALDKTNEVINNLYSQAFSGALGRLLGVDLSAFAGMGALGGEDEEEQETQSEENNNHNEKQQSKNESKTVIDITKISISPLTQLAIINNCNNNSNLNTLSEFGFGSFANAIVKPFYRITKSLVVALNPVLKVVAKIAEYAYYGMKIFQPLVLGIKNTYELIKSKVKAAVITPLMKVHPILGLLANWAVDNFGSGVLSWAVSVTIGGNLLLTFASMQGILNFIKKAFSYLTIDVRSMGALDTVMEVLAPVMSMASTTGALFDNITNTLEDVDKSINLGIDIWDEEVKAAESSK